MEKYVYSKEIPLTTDYIRNVIQNFITTKRVKLIEYENYFNGKHKILNKKPTDIGKPCNKVVVGYPDYILRNYLGYICGVPVTYANDDFEDVLNILKWNDVVNEDSEYLKSCLEYGIAYECTYLDEDGNIRFKVLDSKECIPIYDNTLNGDLLYVIRFYVIDNLDINNPDYFVEVYSTSEIVKYKSGVGFNSFVEIERLPHYFGQVPITVFTLNSEEESIYAKVIGLVDSYETVLSSEIDDWESFCDSMLVLTGIGADDEQLAQAKRNRCICLDIDCSAEYLTKNVPDAQVSNMLKNLNDKIFQVSNCPDFTDEKFFASTGIALRLKLTGFNNVASSIKAQMRKALTKRIELISTILNLTGSESIWRDIEISFTDNLPVDLSDIVQVVNALKGIVSDETLLAQIPFVTDVQAELEKVKAEKEANMELYSFGNNVNNTEDNTEEDTDE